MTKVYKDAAFNLTLDKSLVAYGERCTATLVASGPEMRPGLRIPYRILSGPSPFGSDIVLISFTYDNNEDYYYLHVTLSEPLGINTLEVTQTSGPSVALEKITDILYRYKNPFDRNEVSRTFRATLQAIATDGDLMPGVRAFDFIYSNEYGYFELDENLTCVKSFKNKMSLLSPFDRVFNISLYYMPQFTASALFTNNYTPPTPYPEKTYHQSPEIKIEAVEKNIREGYDAVFKVTYKNVRSGYTLRYKYLDNKGSEEYMDFFETTNKGESIISIPTEKSDITASRIRTLKMWLSDFPKISDTVFITEAPVEAVTGRYLPGEYIIKVPPNAYVEATLIAGGGAGGPAINTRTGNFKVKNNGDNGGNTMIQFNNSIIYASGGTGGHYGAAHNGSAYNDGHNGIPVDNYILEAITENIEIVTNIKGLEGISSRHDHSGGLPVTDLGDEGFNGQGGFGAWGTRYSSGSGYTYGYGGPGASGGMLQIQFRNKHNRTIDMKLNVGFGAKAEILSDKGTVGNNGGDGYGGFAIVAIT